MNKREATKPRVKRQTFDLKESVQESIKILREDVLPQAKSAQRFFGYLWIATEDGYFNRERVDTVVRLEEILKEAEDGKIMVLSGPPARENPRRTQVGSTVIRSDERELKVPVTVGEPTEKKGLFGRIKELFS